LIKTEKEKDVIEISDLEDDDDNQEDSDYFEF